MTIRHWGPLISVLACACGHHGGKSKPDAQVRCDPQDGIQSGTQLKVEWLRSDDGTCVATGIFDSLVQRECTPAMWDDGTSYCTPTNLADALYDDGACTQPLGGSLSSGQPVVSRDTLGRIAHVWNGTTVSTSHSLGPYSVITKRSTNGDCVAISPPCSSYPCYGFDYFPIGNELPRAELVRAAEMAFGADRYMPLFTRADDGLQVQTSTGAFDAVLGTACATRTFRDGTVCEPIGILETSGYTDPSCTQPILYQQAPNATPAKLWRNWNECDSAALHPSQVPRYLQAGAAIVAPATLYVAHSDNGGCYAISPAPAGSYFALTDFNLGVSRNPDSAPGHRLQIIRYAGEVLWRATALFDTELDTECEIATAYDGRQRCLPRDVVTTDTRGDGSTPSDYYTDPACTNQVVVGEYYPGFECALVSGIKFARSANGQLWSVQGPTTCQSLYHPAFDGQKWNCVPIDCSPYAPTNPYYVAQFFLLGSAPLPDSMFAEVQSVIDP